MTTQPLPPEVVDAIRDRVPFNNAQLRGDFTMGGSYIVSSPARVNDDNRRHDLLLVLPVDLGSGRVIPLRFNVNPELVEWLQQELGSA
ncbi:MAG TPA: hypothetical protein VFT75_18435 [Nocardioidaceae bacterium]|nr:hypothetical protein [Nocardioidaceae bacterium]